MYCDDDVLLILLKYHDNIFVRRRKASCDPTRPLDSMYYASIMLYSVSLHVDCLAYSIGLHTHYYIYPGGHSCNLERATTTTTTIIIIIIIIIKLLVSLV
jgi:hypothetical protein